LTPIARAQEVNIGDTTRNFERTLGQKHLRHSRNDCISNNFQSKKYFIVDQLLESKDADFLEKRLLDTVSFPWSASFKIDDFSSVGKSKWNGFQDHPSFLESP